MQDVKAAPEPQSVLFYDGQAQDLVRFCTHNHSFSIVTIDTTYNLGEFYVAPITYHHLMLEDVTTGKHSIMAGLMLVHQCLKFSTFNYFANTLIGCNKSLRNAPEFGTDSDKNLTEAFGHKFPFAFQFRCFVHFKNVQEKLKSLGIPKEKSIKFLDDIFGKFVGRVKMEGLVDASSLEDFDSKLNALEEHWRDCELR